MPNMKPWLRVKARMRRVNRFRCMCARWLSRCSASASSGLRNQHAARGDHIRARTGEIGRQATILLTRCDGVESASPARAIATARNRGSSRGLVFKGNSHLADSLVADLL